MTDLEMMTGKGALRLAKQESGLTQSEIAERLGVSHAVIKRYFNVNDNYMPSLEMIPRLCSVLGNDILMRWMEARLQRGEAVCREEIAAALSRTGESLENLRALVEGDSRAGHAGSRRKADRGIGLHPEPAGRTDRSRRQGKGLFGLPVVEVLEKVKRAGGSPFPAGSESVRSGRARRRSFPPAPPFRDALRASSGTGGVPFRRHGEDRAT